MKIADLTTYAVANPPPHKGGPYWVFLKLTTDNGIAGYGEVYGVPFNPLRVTGLIEDIFERHVAGWDPFRDRAPVAHRVRQRLQPASRLYRDRRAERHRDCLLGHHRQGAGSAIYNLLGGMVHERLRFGNGTCTRSRSPDGRCRSVGVAFQVQYSTSVAAAGTCQLEPYRATRLHGREARSCPPDMSVLDAQAALPWHEVDGTASGRTRPTLQRSGPGPGRCDLLIGDLHGQTSATAERSVWRSDPGFAGIDGVVGYRRAAAAGP